MIKERITRADVEAYKREILEQSVLVGLPEAAAILAVSPSTVRRRVEERRLVPYNDTDGKGVRFLASELREYVREMRREMDG